jgi:hypothetical protein
MLNEKTEKAESAGSLVVLEQGADWPTWVREYQGHATNSVVVAYAPGESLPAFAARVGRRLSELTEELRVAIIACASSTHPECLATRELICRGLLRAMPPHGRGEVLLAANVGANDEAKHALFQLAGELCEGLQGSSRVVRVRFASGRPESGILPGPAPAEIDHPAYRAISSSRVG